MNLRNRQHRVLESVESAPDGASGVVALLVEVLNECGERNVWTW